MTVSSYSEGRVLLDSQVPKKKRSEIPKLKPLVLPETHPTQSPKDCESSIVKNMLHCFLPEDTACVDCANSELLRNVF